MLLYAAILPEENESDVLAQRLPGIGLTFSLHFAVFLPHSAVFWRYGIGLDVFDERHEQISESPSRHTLGQ